MRSGSPRRVAILTADVGEGHLAAARVLAGELKTVDPDAEVTIVDALEVFGPVLRVVLRDAYRAQLRWAPWIFAAFFGLFGRVRGLRALGRVGLSALGARRLERALRAFEPDLVVSTYPAATSVLGTLRRRGRLDATTCATITDLGGVCFWSHPGIDLHLVMHPAMVPLVEREAGAGSARAVAPLTAPGFRAVPPRRAARDLLGLPHEGRVVLVSGGGWGVGDLEGATRAAAELDGTTVVCLVGRNERLQSRLCALFADVEHVRVLGFTDDMPTLLAAGDVLVHTTGGVTCLEALTVGCPIVAFGPPAGHAPTLARAMASLGIAAYARTRRELRAALLEPLRAAPGVFARSAAEEVLEARSRPAPLGVRVHSQAATVAVTVGAAVAAFLFAGSRTAFALIADPLHLGPQSVLPAGGPVVGLVVKGTSRDIAPVVRLLAARKETASFAFVQRPTPAERRLLGLHHDEVIEELGKPGVDDWLGTFDKVRDDHAGRFILAPAAGTSTGQYLLARFAGARLVKPSARIRPGAILDSGSGAVERLLALLAARGFRAEAIDSLGVPPPDA
ncbi:MAG TPA: glycosyltransferase [Gaiellaceae bacterium]|nr:glycosyltransferase [Gaiellaceae bacterium]